MGKAEEKNGSSVLGFLFQSPAGRKIKEQNVAKLTSGGCEALIFLAEGVTGKNCTILYFCSLLFVFPLLPLKALLVKEFNFIYSEGKRKFSGIC